MYLFQFSFMHNVHYGEGTIIYILKLKLNEALDLLSWNPLSFVRQMQYCNIMRHLLFQRQRRCHRKLQGKKHSKSASQNVMLDMINMHFFVN